MPGTTMLRSRIALLLGVLALGACNLEDTTIPEGEVVLVVHSVIRPDLPPNFNNRQFVVVERTFAGDIAPSIDSVTGDTTFNDSQDIAIPFGGSPAVPVNDAVVQIVNLSISNDPCGDTTSFFRQGEGVYWSPQSCPTMNVGNRLALIVTATDGRRVYGETTVPALDSAHYFTAAESGAFDTLTQVQFNRDNDTLRVRAFAREGRLLQLEVRRDGDLTDFGTKILVDTSAVTVPGDLINTFVLGDEDDVFRPGRYYVVTVAMTDTNYFDFARSDNNEFTGRGFINRLSGGIGVFGSLASTSMHLKAFGDQTDGREGRYRVHGTLNDSSVVDMEMDIYMQLVDDFSWQSSFIDGQWITGTISTSSDGFYNDDRFVTVVVDTTSYIRTDTLRGNWKPGSWEVGVIASCAGGGGGSDPGSTDPCALENRRLGSLTVDPIGN